MKALATRARALLIVLPAALLLAGCLGGVRLAETASSRPFLPEEFFAGTTQGEGTLEKRFGADRTFRVTGNGRQESGGTFVLDQTIVYADGAIEHRSFRLRRVNASEYTGTLTGASGAVSGRLDGHAFRVRYKMKRGMTLEQRIDLQADGRTALNRATVTWFRVPVARVSETMTR
ncbi:MAG: DUF3833 domain-containing protein [Acidobacteriota bacterium]|nr:DUF3833 domain-containing protein [Acidobacteriota bacterium]